MVRSTTGAASAGPASRRGGISSMTSPPGIWSRVRVRAPREGGGREARVGAQAHKAHAQAGAGVTQGVRCCPQSRSLEAAAGRTAGDPVAAGSPAPLLPLQRRRTCQVIASASPRDSGSGPHALLSQASAGPTIGSLHSRRSALRLLKQRGAGAPSALCPLCTAASPTRSAPPLLSSGIPHHRPANTPAPLSISHCARGLACKWSERL